jgi:hypothetical protein
MVDPTSDLCEDITEEEAPRCVVCEEPILQEVSHRVVTRIEDGSVVTTHFCGPEHRAEWSG